MEKTDILIVGAGVVGLSLARELNRRIPDLKIVILEKEDSIAYHASGRNSGVLHAGFYYEPGSLKAKLTVEGNRLITEYCLENSLAINRCGKCIVASCENDHEIIKKLKERGDLNGAEVEIVDEKQLNEIEPNAKTYGKALFSPNTSSVDPREFMTHLSQTLTQKKDISIFQNERYIRSVKSGIIETNKQKIEYKYLVNAAGLYADQLGHQFGVGYKYKVIPFKGLYMKYKDKSIVRGNIYPCPDMSNPFVGVHFTKSVNGDVKVGPTAIPAFWRENYSGFSRFRLEEFIDIFQTDAKLFYLNRFNFRELALKEFKKYNKDYFIGQASVLVKKMDKESFGDYLAPGIRAQLIDLEELKLVSDFVLEHGENSTHILNAVSPAFTCSFTFARFVADEIEEKWRGM